MARILVVDDYPDFAKLAATLLRHDGHECRTATSVDEAVQAGLDFKPELLIVDWRLKDAAQGGMQVARPLLAALPGLKILIVTGSEADAVREQIGDLPVAKIVEKPFNARDEVRTVLGLP